MTGLGSGEEITRQEAERDAAALDRPRRTHLVHLDAAGWRCACGAAGPGSDLESQQHVPATDLIRWRT